MACLPDSLSYLGELVETHASWVFLGEHTVFKFKKPVDFGFLDFSTVEKRKAACHAEVTLNARLSPGVYLGVVELRREGSRLVVADVCSPDEAEEQAKEVIDYGVKMRRLLDGDRADLLLSQARLDRDKMDQLAAVLAKFHSDCPTSAVISHWGDSAAIANNLEENFNQTRPFLADLVGAENARQLEEEQRAFLRDNKSLFSSRTREGFVRDGHGDLRLEHVYFDNAQIEIIDCIEFNERFRYADTCADLAFLAMDLRHEGAPALAERLLSQYARLSCDYGLYATVGFYESYRAYVRGKVTAFLLQQQPEGEKRTTLRNKATTYFQQALAVLRPASEAPRLVCVGGLIASGKSTLAQRLSDHLNYPVVDTDRTRKHLAGVSPTQSNDDAPFSGQYASDFSVTVYEQAFRSARAVLSSGRSVILEASFTKETQRQGAKNLAQSMGVHVVYVGCQVSYAEAKKRLLERSREESVSDGRLEIYDEFVKRAEPLGPSEFEHQLLLDTSLPEALQQQDLKALALW